MPIDTLLDPTLLAKPEVFGAILLTELRNLKEAVLNRTNELQESIEHEKRNRQQADAALKAELESLDERKVVEAKDMVALDKRYVEGIAEVRSNAKRLEDVERAMDRRRTVEKAVVGVGSTVCGVVGWMVTQMISAGYLHH